MMQNRAKMEPKWHQNRSKKRGQLQNAIFNKSCSPCSAGLIFAPILVPTWLHFGRILGVLGASGRLLGRLGASWGRLGTVLGRLGGILGRLGASWGRLGGVLGASWGVLGASWGHLGSVLGRLGVVLGRFSRHVILEAMF